MWKEIDGVTFTIWVTGGAVIRHTEVQESGNGIAIASSMVFVPMDFDAWKVLWVKDDGDE